MASSKAEGTGVALWVKNLLFTIVFPGTLAVWVPLRYLIQREPSYGADRVFFGGIPILLGVAGYVGCVWDFAVRGRGTPFPLDPPKTLQARGLYRFCRNPMYLSVLQVVLGFAIMFESLPLLVYGAGLFLLFHSWTLFYEEPKLMKTFGAAYVDYCRTTPRWIPTLKKKDAHAP